ncbi:uncharacterized protein LOC107267216 [Cephus cinctus]|uniref:Uncharacterized protein LOC107267216 n=1 Tax=Cephus cinctus TaxID=211228 RepID=A0AAJ7BTP7_CEPCN|nr:uncharacterized protein LOC107267216 [Cephus cinctus]
MKVVQIQLTEVGGLADLCRSVACYFTFVLHYVSYCDKKKQIRKNTNGEQVNWLQVCWMRFLKSAPYTILYKTSMKDKEFKTTNLLPTRPRRPLNFEKIALAPLYQDARPITYEKYKGINQSLPYIPPVHHAYLETLPQAELSMSCQPTLLLLAAPFAVRVPTHNLAFIEQRLEVAIGT